MNNRDARKALDEVGEAISELARALDDAWARALAIEAHDAVQSIGAAKDAAVRGSRCVEELRRTLSSGD